MAFLKNAGRQYPLVAVQAVDYTGYTSGVAVEAVQLPPNARVLAVNFYTDVAFNGSVSTSLTVAGGGTTFINAQDIQSVGSETATQSVGKLFAAGGEISLTITNGGTAPTAGSGVLIVQYVIDGRANDVQG